MTVKRLERYLPLVKLLAKKKFGLMLSHCSSGQEQMIDNLSIIMLATLSITKAEQV